MGAPELGRTNKVTVGQKFLSLVGLDERISKLEAKVQEQEALLEEQETTITDQIVVINELAGHLNDDAELIKTLTDKHNQHLKFGHKEGKKND